MKSTNDRFVRNRNSLIKPTTQRQGLPGAPNKPALPATSAVARETETDSQYPNPASVVIWPLTEKSRVEGQTRTLVSDTGLFEIDVADVTEIVFEDAGGIERQMILRPPSE